MLDLLRIPMLLGRVYRSSEAIGLRRTQTTIPSREAPAVNSQREPGARSPVSGMSPAVVTSVPAASAASVTGSEGTEGPTGPRGTVGVVGT